MFGIIKLTREVIKLRDALRKSHFILVTRQDKIMTVLDDLKTEISNTVSASSDIISKLLDKISNAPLPGSNSSGATIQDSDIQPLIDQLRQATKDMKSRTDSVLNPPASAPLPVSPPSTPSPVSGPGSAEASIIDGSTGLPVDPNAPVGSTDSASHAPKLPPPLA